MSVATSLFDAPKGSPLTEASAWVTGTLLGSVAVTLCVIAVAFVGLRMLTGHIAARDGMRVMVGCFVLLGASAIAAGLRDTANSFADDSAVQPIVIGPYPAPPPAQTPEPYHGASMRRD